MKMLIPFLMLILWMKTALADYSTEYSYKNHTKRKLFPGQFLVAMDVSTIT
jgi:hypothetical protein